MATEKIAEKRWLYTLYRLADGSIVLSVLCGGAAIYELNVLLNEEVSARAVRDEKFLDKFASEVREHPGQYYGRSNAL